jgi:hypothetical protein
MMRKVAQVTLSAFFAATAVLAATSANAADVTGKWYGKLDSEPVITISKTGPGYSASLDYPDITRTVHPSWSIRPRAQSIHKDIASFEVAGNMVRFTIRSIISSNGDTGYARDEYNLTLSEDGGQLTGTVRRTANADTGLTDDHVPTGVGPITLFSTDFATRSQP